MIPLFPTGGADKNQGVRQPITRFADGYDRQPKPYESGEPFLWRDVMTIGFGDQKPPAGKVLSGAPRHFPRVINTKPAIGRVTQKPNAVPASSYETVKAACVAVRARAILNGVGNRVGVGSGRACVFMPAIVTNRRGPLILLRPKNGRRP